MRGKSYFILFLLTVFAVLLSEYFRSPSDENQAAEPIVLFHSDFGEEHDHKNRLLHHFITNELFTEDICYLRKTHQTLPNILKARQPQKKLIIFHDTNCRSLKHGKLVLKAREACAIESAALHHPDYDILVLVFAPIDIQGGRDVENDTIPTLFKYKNIKFFHASIEEYIKDTPLEELYGQEGLSRLFMHLTDVVKFVTMWKFGGIYMDLDVIVLRSLDDAAASFIGMESAAVVGTNVMRFSMGKGRRWAEKCLVDFNEQYSSSSWTYSTNEILTRLLTEICKTPNKTLWNKKQCDGIEIYPPETFYPISWKNWKHFFEEDYLESTMQQVKKSKTIHIWNYVSSKKKINADVRKSALSLLARKNCPQISNHFGLEF